MTTTWNGSIAPTPDSRFTDWNIAGVSTDALVAYLTEANFGAYTAHNTDKAAYEDAVERLTAELLRRRKAARA